MLEEKLNELLALKNKKRELEDKISSLEQDILSGLSFGDKTSLTVRAGDLKLTAQRKFKYTLGENAPYEAYEIKQAPRAVYCKQHVGEPWLSVEEQKTSLTVVREC